MSFACCISVETKANFIEYVKTSLDPSLEDYPESIITACWTHQNSTQFEGYSGMSLI